MLYGYDLLGQRTSMMDTSGDSVYTYDGSGRITSVTTYRKPAEAGAISYSVGKGVSQMSCYINFASAVYGVYSMGIGENPAAPSQNMMLIGPNREGYVVEGLTGGAIYLIPGTTIAFFEEGKNDTAEDSETPTVDYKGEEHPVYRGGDDFTVKNNEIKINPDTVSKFGGAYKIESLPEGLEIIQRGGRAEHFEIVPAYEMPLKTFQDLLNQIDISGPY